MLAAHLFIYTACSSLLICTPEQNRHENNLTGCCLFTQQSDQ